MGSMRRVVSALVAAGTACALAAPPAAGSTADEIDLAAAVTAINAACAATEPLAQTGMRAVTEGSGELAGAYDAVSGVAERARITAGSNREIWTANPLARYWQVWHGDTFVGRAIERLGSDATWVVDSAPEMPFADAVPSPGSRISEELQPPGTARQPSVSCASSLLANPEDGYVHVERTVAPGDTAWKIIAGADFYGLDPDYDNGVLMVVHVDDHGVINRIGAGFMASDGIGGVGVTYVWEFGVNPTVTVPSGTEVVAQDEVMAARATFIRRDLTSLARAATRRPLPTATVSRLRSRIRGTLAVTALDPAFPSGMDRARGGATVWQRDTLSGTTHAVRFALDRGSRRITFRVVDATS